MRRRTQLRDALAGLAAAVVALGLAWLGAYAFAEDLVWRASQQLAAPEDAQRVTWVRLDPAAALDPVIEALAAADVALIVLDRPAQPGVGATHELLARARTATDEVEQLRELDRRLSQLGGGNASSGTALRLKRWYDRSEVAGRAAEALSDLDAALGPVRGEAATGQAPLLAATPAAGVLPARTPWGGLAPGGLGTGTPQALHAGPGNGAAQLYAPRAPDALERPGRVTLLIQTAQGPVPTLAAVAAATALGRVAEVDARGRLSLGEGPLGLDAGGGMRPLPGLRIPTLDAATLLTEGAPDPWAGRVVVLGAAPSLATAIAALAEDRLLPSPANALLWLLLSLGIVSAWLVLIRPWLGPAVAIAGSLALALIALAGGLGLALLGIAWLPLGMAAGTVLVGEALLLATRGPPGGRSVTLDRGEHARLQALALQAEGEVELAFRKLREQPLNEALMPALYGLARESERRGRRTTAAEVYRHMSAFDPDFRDIRQRLGITAARPVAEGQATDGGSGDSAPKMLGRYRIEGTLGRGSMGIVYKGSDTKIGRTVAIKTLALTQEFEEGDVEAVKSRFFREAETAGRLSHPHIVTVFDAGEDADLAFIAMEFLQGETLAAYTRPDRLLPIPEAMELIAKCADALAYAHGQRVVHRDIKPANVIYNQRRDELKITDFGIARITDASRTKTGVVLGTPSYMSPEQLTGQPVDGRSDLFSLGVMLYQLVTGQLPFQADTISSLMFRIANEPHAPLRALRPDAPQCLHAVIERALAKSRDQRYQVGSAMARELRSCARMAGV